MSANNVIFYFDNILLAPDIHKNLLSVYALTSNNNVSVEFFANFFIIKNTRTNQIFYRGQNKDGLYSLPLKLVPPVSPQVKYVEFKTWHQRLVHVIDRTVSHVLSFNKLSFINKNDHIPCHACSLSKMHKLPFAKSSTVVTQPLELICLDVWVPFRFHLLMVIYIMSCSMIILVIILGFIF